jgi:integrase
MVKATEAVPVLAAPDGYRRPLVPSVANDADVAGLRLHVTTRRAFWSLSYQPRGLNPGTGKRWGGGVRHELGDAFAMTVAEARTAALAAKALVRQGRDPHREHMVSRASAVAERGVLASTAAETLEAYDRAMTARRHPSERTRMQAARYARKAVRLMKAERVALSAIEAGMVRLMVETMAGSDAERRLVFGSLNRFLSWARKQGLIEHNVCGDLDADERPKPGKARDHVPTLKTLRAVWEAVEDEPQRDLIRFLVLVPVRRDEGAGLRWSEVDPNQARIRISADRMKNREAHELPLSEQALTILEARRKAAHGDLVFASSAGTPHTGWNKLLKRIRKRIGEGETAKAQRFSLHDIRRSFVSYLAGRFDVDALDQVLAHTRRGVVGVYQRSRRMPERERALGEWANLLTGNVQAENVVPLRPTSAA